MTKIVRVLGVDPGSRNLGLALVEFGAKPAVMKTLLYDVASNYGELKLALDDFNAIEIDLLAIEKPIFMAGRMAVQYQVVEIIGILKYHYQAQYGNALKIVEMAPTQIKKAVTGNGKAEKAEMYGAMERIYGKGIIDKNDKAKYGAVSKGKWSHETDALLCAYAASPLAH